MIKKIVGVIPSVSDSSYFVPHTYLTFAKEVMLGKIRIIHDPSDIKGCEEILLLGGADINPTLFDEENYASRKVNTTMDKFHIACIEAALGSGANIFGICRGFQLIYYYFLRHIDHLHYEQHLGGHNQSDLDLPREGMLHRVIKPRTQQNMFVNSFHHQAVVINRPEANPHPIHTWITTYGNTKACPAILEGVHFVVGGSNIAGVQWHPEELSISQEEYLSYFNENPTTL